MQLLEAGLSSSQIASSALSLLGKTSFKLDVDSAESSLFRQGHELESGTVLLK